MSFPELRLNDSPYHPEINPNQRIVTQDSWAEIVASRQESKSIATFNLQGCIGVSLIIPKYNGRRVAYLQHFSPDKSNEGVAALAAVIRRHKPVDLQKAKGVIMTPLETAGPNNPDKGTLKGELFEGLMTKHAIDWGSMPELRVYSYNSNELAAGYDGSLLIDLGINGIDTIYAESIPVLSVPNS